MSQIQLYNNQLTFHPLHFHSTSVTSQKTGITFTNIIIINSVLYKEAKSSVTLQSYGSLFSKYKQNNPLHYSTIVTPPCYKDLDNYSTYFSRFTTFHFQQRLQDLFLNITDLQSLTLYSHNIIFIYFAAWLSLPPGHIFIWCTAIFSPCL